ncbi:MAG TPA: HEAT repeat domain-containing protein [Planctomycetota bacterium]|nr:HEAT repeat domain-containing protein [Planctomycetota bacterium]
MLNPRPETRNQHRRGPAWAGAPGLRLTGGTPAALLLLLALAGCVPPPLRPPEAVVVQPVQRSVTVWPTVQVDAVPGEFAPPWPARPGAELELWQIDLLDLERPDLMAWLETWQPRRERLARPVPVEAASNPQQRLRLAQHGAYVLRSRAGGETQLALVLASRTRVALSLDDNDCEVLCADAQTGKPVRGAYVQVVYRTERLGSERVLRASGSTDADGRWHTSLVRDRFAPSVLATVVACRGSEYAIATERRALDHSETSCRLTLRARSQVLRPGQTAELGGALQARRGPRLAPWTDAQLRLLLLDPSGVVAGTARARTDEVGSFAAAFELRKDAPTGPYTVVATVEDASRPAAAAPSWAGPWRFDAFSVATPTPMPFRLKLSLDRAIVAPGDTLELKAEATRGDGTPIAGARVRLLTWGYPVALDGSPRWATEGEALDPARIVVLPIQLPVVAETDAQGCLALRWQVTRAELPQEDLLCGVQVEVLAPDLGAVERAAEFVLLRQAHPVSFAASARFFRPSDPIELSLTSPLPPAEQAKTMAACSLTHEDRDGVPHTREVVRAPIAWLVSQRLKTTATSPGRYVFRVEAAGVSSELAVWVVEGEQDAYGGVAGAPALIAERPWLRRGESMQAVAAAPGRDAPLALTLRAGASVAWRTVPLRTGARGLRLQAGERDEGPVEISLVQIAGGQGRAGRARLGIEPGGRGLDVQPRLLWVRQGEWSGRGYGITTRDPAGQAVQSVVHLELIRPTFQGTPPAAVLRKTVHWHPGKATSEGGEIEVGFHDSLLDSASTLLVDALTPSGRSGLLLMAIRTPAYIPDLKQGVSPGPRARLAALAQHGLDTRLAQWLAARLVAGHPELADELPGLLAAAKGDEEAMAIVALGVAHPPAARAIVEAAVRRGGPVAQGALAPAAGCLPELLPVFESALAAGANPLVRAAAARGLARAFPSSRKALVEAMGADEDPIVRAAAAAALGHAGQAAIPSLADAARGDPATAVRLAAIGALQQVGGIPAATVLLDLTADASDEVVAAALRALEEVGYRGADERLFRILGAGASDAREAAARLLARTDAPEVTQRVIAAVRAAPSGPLLRALAPLRSRAVQAAMSRWLSHGDPEVQLAAAEYLASIQHESAPAALRKFLEPDAPAAAADRAAAALLALRDTTAAPKLVALLESGRLSPATRRGLVETAGKLGLQQAGPALIAILWRGLADPSRLRQPEERQLWASALEAAASVGPIWSPLIESAVGSVPSGSPYAPAFVALRAEGLAAFLAELWRSPLPDDLRRHTVVPFARLRGAAGVSQVVELLESPVLQGPAMRALGEAGAVDALLAALPGRSAVTRSAVAAALGAAGDARAVPSLQPLLADADPFVRCEAAHALAAITRQAIAYTDCLGEPRQASP